MKKILMSLIAVTLMATSSFAGEGPEFDVVGCDASNYFNDKIRDIVIDQSVNLSDDKINYYSDWTPTKVEDFYAVGATRGQEDPCFPGYETKLTTPYRQAFYTWKIVLQKQPETDLDIAIRDCVMKPNSFDPFGEFWLEGTFQTGRYFENDGWNWWIPQANPKISVMASPGEQSIGFTPFYLMGRLMPTLGDTPLKDASFTSKGVWEETIVAALPETGLPGADGGVQAMLVEGDIITVTIEVGPVNFSNVNYGSDNVSINYVGVYGTEYWTETACAPVP